MLAYSTNTRSAVRRIRSHIRAGTATHALPSRTLRRWNRTGATYRTAPRGNRPCRILVTPHKPTDKSSDIYRVACGVDTLLFADCHFSSIIMSIELEKCSQPLRSTPEAGTAVVLGWCDAVSGWGTEGCVAPLEAACVAVVVVIGLGGRIWRRVGEGVGVDEGEGGGERR
jgi:hypothetical protein